MSAPTRLHAEHELKDRLNTVAPVSTGVDGLDEILGGGLPDGRSYLVRGGPGTGKTTLGLHFLSAGAAIGDRGLYITLTAPESAVRSDAATVGLSLDDVMMLDLSPSHHSLTGGDFSNVDLDELLVPDHRSRTPIVRSILALAQEQRPRRVVIDSMTYFRELTIDADEFRDHTLALIGALASLPATVLFTSEYAAGAPDDDLQFLADGVISLETTGVARTLAVTKMRGAKFHPGNHSVRIGAGGMRVYPRLSTVLGHQEDAVPQDLAFETLPFGVPELDRMLDGGLERGTMTLIGGPSGAGKTTIAAQFMKEAAGRGERSVVFMFDEHIRTFIHRCESLGMPLRQMMAQGKLEVRSIEPLAHSADEISELVRTEVESFGTSVVLFDSISSYKLSTDSEDISVNMHAIGRYLKAKGVTGLMIDEVPAVTGVFEVSKHQVSYLADTVMFLRYFEIDGELRKAIGVLKKRTGDFENALRELTFTKYGISVGNPLKQLQGVLSGMPTETSTHIPDRTS